MSNFSLDDIGKEHMHFKNFKDSSLEWKYLHVFLALDGASGHEEICRKKEFKITPTYTGPKSFSV